MAKKKKSDLDKSSDEGQKPEVHEELEGFNIRVNEFGEIVTNVGINRLNEFLDEKVKDKKLTDEQIEARDEQSDEEE